MPASELFTHWSFESFVPGSIPRVKYNAFCRLHRQTGLCLSLLAQFEELAMEQKVVDWCRVSLLATRLSSAIRDLVDQLQVMNPVEFMDAHDWVAKVSFYTRLATEHTAFSARPPYLLADPAESGHAWVNDRLPAGHCGPVLVITAALYQYFLEANDLRPGLDSILQELDLGDQEQAIALGRQARTLIRQGKLPSRLQAELEIAAVELAPGGTHIDLAVFAGLGEDAAPIGQYHGVRSVDFVDAWLEAATCKFSLSALSLRLSRGLADEEHPLTVVATPAASADSAGTCDLWPGQSDPVALMARLEQVLSRTTRLHVFKAQGEALRPEHCRSLHDLVCLCMERGLAGIFAFAGEPARGLSGIKRMRLEIPVIINTFNLGGGLFPTAAERAVISMEDVRSIPAWSFLLGLATFAVSWGPAEQDEEATMPHHSSYAVLSQFFVHCTLRLGQNLYVVECSCEDGREKYVQFRFTGGNAGRTEKLTRREILLHILRGEGFTVSACGDHLDAVRSGEEDVYLQRNLVCLGLLVAWMQNQPLAELTAMGPAQGAERFQLARREALSSPL